METPPDLELWRYIRRPHKARTTIFRLLARDSADGLREAHEPDSLADVHVKAMAASA